MDLAPAMDNGTCPPIDPDRNYIGQHPPYGAGDNFNHQPTPMAAGNKQPYVINGIIVLPSFLVLFTIILFIFVICVYRGSSLYGMTNISWRRRFSFARDDPLYLRNVGLDARVIESLPVFEYKGQSFKEALECAVCLSEFEENEKARLLPNCKHSFHVDCIDMWFRSHSTCPICRRGAQPKQRVIDKSASAQDLNMGKRALKEQKSPWTKGHPREESLRCRKPTLIYPGGLKASQAKNRCVCTVDCSPQKLRSIH